MNILIFKELRLKKGIHYTRDHTRRLCKKGQFPRPIELGGGGRIGWIEEEIDAYIAARAAARDALSKDEMPAGYKACFNYPAE